MEVEELKKKVEEFAQEIGLTKDQYDEVVEKATKEMEARGVADDQLETYIYKRVQFALKQKARGAGQQAEGFFIGQQAVVDYARNPRQKAIDFVAEEGTKKAVSLRICDDNKNSLPFWIDPKTKQPVVPSDDEEESNLEKVPPLSETDLLEYITKLGEIEAKRAGLMNEDGSYVFTGPKWKKGRVIPDHEYGCTAYGIFKMPGDTEPKMAEVNMSGDIANTILPLFQIVKFPSRVNKDKSRADFYRLSMSKTISEEGDDVDYTQFDALVRSTFPERRLDAIDELDDFVDDHTDFNEWCVVDADIDEVGTTVSQFDSIAVRIASGGFAMTDEITLWVNKDRAKGLVETGDAVVVIKPKRRNDGTISGDLIGYYIDPTFRPTDSDDVAADDVLRPW